MQTKLRNIMQLYHLNQTGMEKYLPTSPSSSDTDSLAY